MASSAAKSPEQYLAELPPARREVIERVRQLILASLPPGYEEKVGWGMLCYQIPLERYPDTYNGHPLGTVAVAAQKNAYSIYLAGLYMYGEERHEKFREAWLATGKRLDMGKGCIRFRRLDELVPELIAQAVAEIPVDEYIRQYEKVRQGTAMGIRPLKKKAAKKVESKGSNKGKMASRSSSLAKSKSANKGKTASRSGAASGQVKSKGSNNGKTALRSRAVSSPAKSKGSSKGKPEARGGSPTRPGRPRR